jgi:predicted nucleotide-binding protein
LISSWDSPGANVLENSTFETGGFWGGLPKLAEKCRAFSEELNQVPLQGVIKKLNDAVRVVGRSSSNSWIGYQSSVYYKNFQSPRPADHFSSEWGLQSVFSHPNSGNWIEVTRDQVDSEIMRLAERPNLTALEQRSYQVESQFRSIQREVVTWLTLAVERARSAEIEELRDKAKVLTSKFAVPDLIGAATPKGQFMTRDSLAMGQGLIAPHHIRFECEIRSLSSPFFLFGELGDIAENAASYMRQKFAPAVTGPALNGTVFIGHGRSDDWNKLSAFIGERLKLKWDEFNRESSAGLSIKERLETMLDQASFALLLMTAEDEHADKSLHARENVIHEIGLFQGRLGFRKAIILLEEGCKEFSNVHGIGQIRYPKGYINATYEEIRRVLEREGVLMKNSD